MSPFVALALGLGAVLGAGGWGWAIATRAGRSPTADPDRLLGYPFVGLIAAALLGSVLWITGGFVPSLAWTLVAGGLALCVAAVRRDGRQALADFRAHLSPFRKSVFALWCVAIGIMLPILLAPDTSWDSSTFHLVIPREAAQAGALPLNSDDPFLLNLLTGHALLGWGYLLGGAEQSVTARCLAAALAGLGLALATRRLARRFHPRVGVLALALVVTTPLWLVQWGTAMAELNVFTLSAAGLALTLISRERRWTAVGMIALATAAATKHWGVLVPASLAALWGIDALRTRRIAPVGRAFLLGAACLLVVSPWLVKNEQLFGVPFVHDLGQEDPAVMAQYALFEGASPAQPVFHTEERDLNLLFPLKVILRLALGYPWTAALSPLLFAGALLALFAARPGRWTAAWLGAGLVFAMYVLLIPGLQSTAPTRYFFSVAPWAYFLAALGWHHWAGERAARIRAVGVLLAVTVLPSLVLVGARGANRLPYLAGRESSEDFWARRDPATPLIAHLNRTIEKNDRVFVVGERVIQLSIPRPQIIRHFQAYRAGVTSAQTLREAWDRWGITHVLVDDYPGERFGWGVEREWVREPSPALEGWDLLDENGGARLYRRRMPLDDALGAQSRQ